MMKSKSKSALIITIVAICYAITAIVDGVIQPDYWIKSGVKFSLFLVLPLVYLIYDKSLNFKELFIPNKKGVQAAILLCVPLYILIVGGYLLLKDVFDFSQVTTTLTATIGVTKNNFVLVALYISFINSFMEEFFFRGFAFLTLKKVSSAKFAYIFSAAVFSLYHIAMMTGWFSLPLFILLLAGLFAGGLIFNFLNTKSGNIYTSWLVHMFANFAINTVGFMLFGIL